MAVCVLHCVIAAVWLGREDLNSLMCKLYLEPWTYTLRRQTELNWIQEISLLPIYKSQQVFCEFFVYLAVILHPIVTTIVLFFSDTFKNMSLQLVIDANSFCIVCAYQKMCLQTHCWGPCWADVTMSSGWCRHWWETAHKPKKETTPNHKKRNIKHKCSASVTPKSVSLTPTPEYCERWLKQRHYENKAESWCTLRAIAVIHKLQIHAPPHPDLGTIHHEKSLP